ncbi:1-acyl-sn-glycerol-3-phosphate acyltransferase [Hymenobacter persicinus]|uniref:1-acyl-sn-glycerol-3-phosphate acyltransferase n=1 Tax=Hymenobacter persicinus TaxID=2025506 RepID=A0A4Q5LBS8_9BACT|nr:1-acyl-sn-glycerol-3-phosphate acyltransferase [Hymenobacter persicinus]
MPFVVTYPAQLVLRRRPTWHPYLHSINRGWSKFAIRMWGMPVDVVQKNPLPAGTTCLYVANHSSYIDIPLLFKAVPGFLNIVGKSSLAEVPLWGPIFGSTYITVNRDSAVSRGRAMVQARKSLEAGRSVVIFPEGKISPTPGQQMLPFKDGAFQLAIATGVPVVPISMPLNHRFMPDVAGTLRVRYSPLRIVLHEPIQTKNLTAADVPALKEQAFRIIASEFRPDAAGIPEASTLRAPKPTPAPEPVSASAARVESPEPSRSSS